MTAAFILNKELVQFRLNLKDPFLFAGHHFDAYPAGNADMAPVAIDRPVDWGQDFEPQAPFRMYHGDAVPGFPAHPHTGFETVTIVEQGYADHFDSRGASGRYGEGDVQWLTTGAGVQHSEMFPLLSTEHDNPLELFQLWLNLPEKDKQAPAAYKMLWHEDIPVINVQDADGHGYSIKVIAGRFGDTAALSPTPHSWANNPDNGVNIFMLNLAPHARLNLPASAAGMTRFAYLFEGSHLALNGERINHKELVDLDASVDLTLVNGEQAARILWLEGKPIGEGVEQYGPFVASSREKLVAAVQAYQQDEFGGWPWGRNDPVFPREQGRIAKFDHGNRTELPPNGHNL